MYYILFNELAQQTNNNKILESISTDVEHILKCCLLKKNRRGTSTRDLGVENGGVDSGFRRSHIPYKT